MVHSRLHTHYTPSQVASLVHSLRFTAHRYTISIYTITGLSCILQF